MRKLYLAGEKDSCRTIFGAFMKECQVNGIEISGYIEPSTGLVFSYETGEAECHVGDLVKGNEAIFLQAGGRYFDIPDDRSHSLIHTSAIISDNVLFGKNTVVMPGCLFYPNFSSGQFNIFMNSFRSGHDIVVGDSCFFAYYSFLGSFVTIGSGVRLGIKSMVKEYVRAGNNSYLKPGSILVENMNEGETRNGIPAKPLKK